MSILGIFCLLAALETGPNLQAFPNGTILSTQEGFPFKTYSEWISFLKNKNPEFNAESFGKVYPESKFRDYQNTVHFQEITYASDGLKVAGFLAIPKQEKGQSYPVIIFNRGGNQEFGSLSFTRLFWLFDLVKDGYIVVASQYRGNGGGEGKEQFGGTDVDDILNLIPLVEKLPQADSTRIGMFGWSRGGMMTYLALARTDRISAAVIGGGLSDLFLTCRNRPTMETGVIAELVPDYYQTKEKALEARSAVRWAEKLNKKTPILLLHGSADWRVSPHQALDMANRLLETQHPFRLVLLEGGSHGLKEHVEEVRRLYQQWFNNYLRDKKPWPSLAPHEK